MAKIAAKRAISFAKHTMRKATPRRIITFKLPKSESQQVLLTFDDGPCANYSARVLNALDKINARAIFFLLGREVQKNPTIAREIAAAGHEIGNHTFTHPHAADLSLERAKEELSSTQKVIEDEIGVTPRLFRPPYGEVNFTLLRACWAQKLGVVHWSNEGGEWGRFSDQCAAQIAGRLGQELVDGDIVLLHDNNEKVPDMLRHPAFVDKMSDMECGPSVVSAVNAAASRMPSAETSTSAH